MRAGDDRGNGPVPTALLGLFPASLPLARSLGRRGIPVYGLDAGEGAIAGGSRHLTRVPIPKDEEELLEFLLEFSRKLKSRFVVVPFSDAYVLFLAKHHQVLAEACFFPMKHPQRVMDLVGKIESDTLFTRLGIPHPKTVCLHRGLTRYPDAGNVSYPCLLKPNLHDSWQASPLFRGTMGSQNRVLLVQDRRTLESWIRVLGLLDDTLLQEYVVGPSENHFYYVGYRDRGGQILLSFVGNKIRTLPDCLGSETLLRSVHRPDILRQGEEILAALDYHGPAGIDFKYDPRDDTMKVIEVNCRIGLNDCYLTRYGMDLPWVYYRESQGLDVLAQSSYPAGIVWYDLFRDLEWLRDHRKQLGLSWTDWLSSLRAPGSEALFDWSDPAPFMRAASALVSRVLRRPFRRRSTAPSELPNCKHEHPSAGPRPQASSRDAPPAIKDCVMEAIVGVGGGKRDREIGCAITMELRRQGFDREQACEVLAYGWNANAQGPLPHEEIASIVEEAYSGKLDGYECADGSLLREMFRCVGEERCHYRQYIARQAPSSSVAPTPRDQERSSSRSR